MEKIHKTSKYQKHEWNLNADQYKKMYEESVQNPHTFWKNHAKSMLHWHKPFTTVKNTNFFEGNVDIKWFPEGELNVCYNCIDRHAQVNPDQVAVIWEGDNPQESKNYTYGDLHREIQKFANALKHIGVKKSDVVVIYMPMIIETMLAILACARIGAIHSVVFGGFSPKSIASRIEDSKTKFIVTADEGLRGSRVIPLKENINQALAESGTESIEKVLIVKRTGAAVKAHAKDIWYDDIYHSLDAECPVEPMKSEDPLFILYTSGSTGKPKGLIHSSAGYLLYAAMTFRYVFSYQPDEVFWCTADVGWITGHSYVIYGALANGATSLMFEGVPNYPTTGRFGEVIQKHKVNHIYTAPTAIRALMKDGDHIFDHCDLSSLKTLGTVGEPINPEVWTWYSKIFGKGQIPIVDTWWQTETGGHLITPLAGATDLKPGSATLPFFGIQPALLNKDGNEIQGAGEGYLVIKDSWPGQSRTIYGDHKRFEETYFSMFKNYYLSGDGARRDEDGYYWIIGRIDDVINVSGHRIGTAEIESAVVSYKGVAESAVVGFPHDIKGEGIYAFVILQKGVEDSQELNQTLIKHVRAEIGAIATIDHLVFVPDLPKTRSGKIMRRILRKISSNESESLGDISTLANPDIVEVLIEKVEVLIEK